jgi:superfamily II DNA or RNA helicase
MQLRDYQETDLVRLRQAMRAGQEVLYVALTGSGKTVLFAAGERRIPIPTRERAAPPA